MSRTDHKDITIGTLAPMRNAPDYLKQIKHHGFESYELTMWAHIDDNDLPMIAREVQDEIAGIAVISSVGLYGNPLQDEKTARDWETVIKSAKLFGARVVCGFAGALEDKPVDESMPKFKEVFGHLAKVPMARE